LQDVVVTGLGIVSGLGNTAGDFERRLFAGETAIRMISSFDPKRFRTQIGAEAEGVDFRPYIRPGDLNLYDRVSLLAIAAADQAVADAGLNSAEDKARLGVILGTGFGPAAAIEYAVLRAHANQRLRPATILKIMLNSPAAALCARYQCREVSHVHVTACAASAQAIGQAADYIRNGALELCLAGGCDAFPSEGLFAAWDALGVMTTGNTAPDRAVRPFAADRDGFAIGEGAAILVLESKARAVRRGARIYAEIVGVGSGSHTPSLAKPSVEGMANAMSRALVAADLSPDAIGYINAHGTATDINDSFETQALHKVLGGAARRVRISSTKAAHGHTMGAAGAIEAMATIMALNRGFAPPTLNLRKPDPICDLDYTPDQIQPFDGAFALSNSFAFGGHYVSIALKRGER
jgi:3-oxoacyl-[acyl-carrier-protein] synthase II